MSKRRGNGIPKERKDPAAWYGIEGWDSRNWRGTEKVLPKWAKDIIAEEREHARKIDEASQAEDDQSDESSEE